MRKINEFIQTDAKDLKFVAKPNKDYKGNFSTYRIFVHDYPYTIGNVSVKEYGFKLFNCSDDRIGFDMCRDSRRHVLHETLGEALAAFKVFYLAARERAEDRLAEIINLGEVDFTKVSDSLGDTVDVSVWKAEGNIFNDWWKIRAKLTYGQIFKLMETRVWHVDFEDAVKWVVYAMEDSYSIESFSGHRLARSHTLGYRKGFK